jgi:hypothetical protein
MEQMPHTELPKSKRIDDPTFNEGRDGNADASDGHVHAWLQVCLKKAGHARPQSAIGGIDGAHR